VDKFGYSMTTKVKEWGDGTKSFITQCGCMSDEHSINTWIETEKDEDIPGMITVHFYQTLKTKWWKKPTKYEWLNSIINRITGIWQLVFKGYIEFHSDFVVNSDNIDGLMAVLKEAKKEIKKCKEQ